MRDIGLVLIILVAIAVTLYFALQPIAEAIGVRIRSKAEQDALDRALARQQRAERFEALLPSLRVLSFVFVVAFVVVTAASGCLYGGWAYARVKAANKRANITTIPIGPGHQYPLLVEEGANGGWNVVNANTGQVLLAGQAHEPVPQLVTASGAVLLAGETGDAAARIARKSGHDAGAAVTGWARYRPVQALPDVETAQGNDTRQVSAKNSPTRVLVAYPLNDEEGEA